ncbi:MAG: glutamate synthase large subunit [Bacteroidota bacterium]
MNALSVGSGSKLCKGLYVPEMESDACGTGLIASLDNTPSHQIVQDALTMLGNMEHRGACGCEPDSGDGAGIMIQLPDAFFREVLAEQAIELPDLGSYGVAMVFLPADSHLAEQCRVHLLDYAHELGLERIASRLVPINNDLVGKTSLRTEPQIEQWFVTSIEAMDRDALDRKLYVLHKYASRQIHGVYPEVDNHFYLASCSTRTIVYKGQLTTWQLPHYYPDLSDPGLASSVAMVHSRFSTNTQPQWRLAQPFRLIAHNGEINTIQGNRKWWGSKEKLMKVAGHFTPEELNLIFPVCSGDMSDSGTFDNVLEFLIMSGFSLPHALMMMIPEAWQEDESMPDYKRAFYEYHKTRMEPWDGPASICFTDGRIVGATLDRNGLRPSRYCLTTDNRLIIASEVGALPVEPSEIVQKGRLQPGRMLVADLEQKRLISDRELKESICSALPYRDWLDAGRLSLNSLPSTGEHDSLPSENYLRTQQLLFGYTREDLKVWLGPMAAKGKDPVGSMGADTPLAVLSHRSPHLADYFKQLFAQVTNPPIDPIRERRVMSLYSMLGSSAPLHDEGPSRAHFIHLDQPLLTDHQLRKLIKLQHPEYRVGVMRCLFRAHGQSGRLSTAIEQLKGRAESLVRSGHNILVISDRGAGPQQAPIPSLMALGAVHQHLVRLGLRAKTSLVVEAGDVREVHHLATLIGFGANAVNPYLALATLDLLYSRGYFEGQGLSRDQAVAHYIHAVGNGLLKIMSKIGISTLQSYQGAQIFEILGLSDEVVNSCFWGTVSRIGGIGFDGIATEVLARHQLAFPGNAQDLTELPEGGLFQWKRRGEAHTFNPKSIHYLQLAARKNSQEDYYRYAREIDKQTEQAMCLRGLLDFRRSNPIPLSEVEPAENIMRRFSTGAMSFGSISWEAHTTLAIAMNRIGAKSNSGEGGEDPCRYKPSESGHDLKSAIKQVASGRFGVTSHYLSEAQEIQIKMAQGAKPGEGGQLPGHKVDEWIGRVRHSTPGVGLISPPPHHDIYSIEDLAQLIFDVKNANPKARINVKLVSKAGVGIIASGVAKAKAEAILISGYDGGTGASPLTSVRHAGLPWELGLAETHQTLVRNKLRDRVVLQTDGQLRTGRDLAIAVLLGAEEFGVATAALVVEGCIMMRKCHVNTCPVGIATQDPLLRKRFTGKPEHVINFFRFLAEDLRSYMAQLGFRTVNEMVGQSQMLKQNKNVAHWKYQQLNLSSLLFKPGSNHPSEIYHTKDQDFELGAVLDQRLIASARPALLFGKSVQTNFTINNTDRAVGTMLSYEISKRWHGEGLPDGLIQFRFRGSAGQSFGAFGAKGIAFTLEGEANDYLGKGLSGGRLIVTPDRDARFSARDNIIIGNVAFYGATSGEAYIRGQAGERFAVRNSGAKLVVEGVGDHACEYMTGGVVVVIGPTGLNFGAGMSGGFAYVYDPQKKLTHLLNKNMVDLDTMNLKDLGLLRRMLRNHFTYTSSRNAYELLLDWPQSCRHFVKVMPREYKRILEHRQDQKLINYVKTAVVA